MRRLAWLSLPLALATGGCLGGGNPYFSDDEGGGPTARLALFEDHPDSLSLPYARGAKVKVAAWAPSGATNLGAWRLRSSKPSVFAVGAVEVEPSSRQLRAECVAAGEGTAELALVDPAGDVVHTASVRVVVPDRARVLRHGVLRTLGRAAPSEAPAVATEARVLEESTGVYAVTYFRGGERAYGHGLLGYTAVPAGFTVSTGSTSGKAANEWLFVRPNGSGAGQLELTAAGSPIGALPLASAAERDIATLSLAVEPVEPGEDGWAYAQAADKSGRPVDGVYCDFALDGARVSRQELSAYDPRPGDLVRFKGAKSTPVVLSAKRGGLTARALVPAASAEVHDTTYFGCG